MNSEKQPLTLRAHHIKNVAVLFHDAQYTNSDEDKKELVAAYVDDQADVIRDSDDEEYAKDILGSTREEMHRYKARLTEVFTQYVTYPNDYPVIVTSEAIKDDICSACVHGNHCTAHRKGLTEDPLYHIFMGGKIQYTLGELREKIQDLYGKYGDSILRFSSLRDAKEYRVRKTHGNLASEYYQWLNAYTQNYDKIIKGQYDLSDKNQLRALGLLYLDCVVTNFSPRFAPVRTSIDSEMNSWAEQRFGPYSYAKESIETYGDYAPYSGLLFQEGVELIEFYQERNGKQYISEGVNLANFALGIL